MLHLHAEAQSLCKQSVRRGLLSQWADRQDGAVSLGSTGAPCDPGGVAVDAQVHLIAAREEGIGTLQSTYAGLSDPQLALHLSYPGPTLDTQDCTARHDCHRTRWYARL